MARSQMHHNLKRLSELPDYTIEPGDPDPRGWTVSMPDGRTIGTVRDLAVDQSARKVRYLIVETDSGSTVTGITAGHDALVRAEDAELDRSARRVTAREVSPDEYGLADAASTMPGTDRSYEQQRITRSEEELEIGTREHEREVRVGKHVETEHVREPVTRRREEVVVERRPVEAGARASAIGDEEIRVPIREEEVVVEKRPVVKEELVVGKRVVEERDTVEADVKRERFDIEGDRDASRDGTTRRGSTRER